MIKKKNVKITNVKIAYSIAEIDKKVYLHRKEYICTFYSNTQLPSLTKWQLCKSPKMCLLSHL